MDRIAVVRIFFISLDSPTSPLINKFQPALGFCGCTFSAWGYSLSPSSHSFKNWAVNLTAMVDCHSTISPTTRTLAKLWHHVQYAGTRAIVILTRPAFAKYDLSKYPSTDYYTQSEMPDSIVDRPHIGIPLRKTRHSSVLFIVPSCSICRCTQGRT
jgi:hypothetical protein